MEIADIATVVAVVLGPVVAVAVGLFIEIRREARARRMEVFRTLMRTRRWQLSPESVGALNLVEIEFSKDAGVLQPLRELMTHLGKPHPRFDDEAVDSVMPPDVRRERDEKFAARLGDERQRLRVRMLHAMARALKFPVQQLEIFEGGYTPQGWVNIEEENEAVRRLFADIGQGTRTLPIGVFNFTNVPLSEGSPEGLTDGDAVDKGKRDKKPK